ncbi:MAG: PEGA domain-containing protein [Myxococcota bacterium]
MSIAAAMIVSSMLSVDTIAVLDVERTDDSLDENFGQTLVSVLAAEVQLRGAGRYRVLARSELRNMIMERANAQMAGCDDPQCYEDLAEMTESKFLLTSTVGQVGDEWVLTLQLVAPWENRVKARQAVSWRGEPSGLLELCRPTVARLLNPQDAETWFGKVDIAAEQTGAAVTIDDNEFGSTPLPNPIPDLAIGKHRLRVTKPGFVGIDYDVIVNKNETTLIQIDLIDESTLEPWYKKWWVWTAIGGVAAAGVVTAILVSSGGDTTVQAEIPLP